MKAQILRSTSDLKDEDIQKLYESFDSPIVSFDCGKKCAPHNPSGKPFCCDICHAVPAAYTSEWTYLKPNTDLWHQWRGNECGTTTKTEVSRIIGDMPKNMVLLACLGPSQCQRDYRTLSCRQFPFFPYVTSNFRFLGLTYEWEFESACWVISNLSRVTQKYRDKFIDTFDNLFALFQDEFDSYALYSEKMRLVFKNQKRRVPLLHRNGKTYLISPASERMTSISPDKLPAFGPYRRD